MRLLSSKLTVFYKRVFPLLWFGFLGLFAIGGIAVAFVEKNFFLAVPTVVIPVVMIVFGYLFMRSLLWDLVDEVWDDGDSLVVRHKGREDRIHFSVIMNVDRTLFMNPARVTLTLRKESQFGKTITFSPPRKGLGFRHSPELTELIERIDDCRQRAAATADARGLRKGP